MHIDVDGNFVAVPVRLNLGNDQKTKAVLSAACQCANGKISDLASTRSASMEALSCDDPEVKTVAEKISSDLKARQLENH